MRNLLLGFFNFIIFFLFLSLNNAYEKKGNEHLRKKTYFK